MELIATFSVTIWNGFLLIIPMLLLRYLLPYMINPKSLPKLQYFPEVKEKEKIALKVYFATITFLIFAPIVHPIRMNSELFTYGLGVYIIGILFIIFSLVSFSRNTNFVYKGIYKISRNPMYIGYFGIFFGVSIMIGSIFYLIITIVYQVCVHFIILSEERWCKDQFGTKYERYTSKVPRYILFF